jgi:hypothetical protein
MTRRIYSISSELTKKSKEAALAAVQIFNNPSITFKSESFIVLMNIAWTYLLHAYYRKNKIEYRYFQVNGTKRKFDKTKHGAVKHWELERCLNDYNSPIDKHTSNNLKFLIGLRHEIEHQMTTKIDDILSAKFQACCLNYNTYLKKLLNEVDSIDKHLSFSLQFSSISTDQKDLLADHLDLPKNIIGFISSFDDNLTDDEFRNPQFSYRIIFVPKSVNHKGQADKVIEFLKSDSSLAEKINADYVITKETEKPKYLAKQVVTKLREQGFPNFTIYAHTCLWKELDGKNPDKGFGTFVAGVNWHWYEKWVDIVVKHCTDSGELYK